MSQALFTSQVKPDPFAPTPDKLLEELNSHVIFALKAARTNDAQALHRAYRKIGIALGVDEACTSFVQHYSKNMSASKEARRFLKPQSFFKDDWGDLEVMVSDVGIVKKIEHVQQFMRRRRFAENVVRTLHYPTTLKLYRDSSCQWEDSKDPSLMVSRDAACQADERFVKDFACQADTRFAEDFACQTEDDMLHLNVACQTQNVLLHLNVACQTVEKFVGQVSVDSQAVACQTTEAGIIQLTKTINGTVPKNTASRKRKRKRVEEPGTVGTKRLASVSKSKTKSKASNGATESTAQPEILPNNRRTRRLLQRLATAAASPKDPSDNERGGEVAEIISPTSPPKDNAQCRKSSDRQLTRLVIQNLHPLVNEKDIAAIFGIFESYKSCKVNIHDCSKLLCAADVFFGEEADAVEAKNQFDGKTLDGFAMNIVVVKSENN